MQAPVCINQCMSRKWCKRMPQVAAMQRSNLLCMVHNDCLQVQQIAWWGKARTCNHCVACKPR